MAVCGRFSFGGLRLAVCVWRFIAGVLRAFCWRFDGGLRATCVWRFEAVCGQFAAGLWTVCGQLAGGLWLAVCGRFASGMQAVCGRFASGLRRVSFAAGFVCRFAFGGLCLSVCVLRFAFCGLRLTVCAWRFALGGLRLAVCTWRFAGGLLAVLRTVGGRIAGGFAGGLRLAVCGRFASGKQAVVGRFAVGGLRLRLTKYTYHEISKTPLPTRSNCASRNAGHLVLHYFHLCNKCFKAFCYVEGPRKPVAWEIAYAGFIFRTLLATTNENFCLIPPLEKILGAPLLLSHQMVGLRSGTEPPSLLRPGMGPVTSKQGPLRPRTIFYEELNGKHAGEGFMSLR